MPPMPGSMNFYVTARCHDIHLLMFACMFLGQYQPALAAADKIQSILTRDILAVQGRPKLAITTEGYYAMKMHVLVRFGRWQEIIDTPLPDDPQLFLVSTAMQHYARGVAFASLKRIAEAEQARTLFHESLGRIPPDRRFLSNPALAMLGVGETMLDGELAYHKGTIRRRSTICGKASGGTTTCPIPSHGPGCTRHGMRWRRC